MRQLLILILFALISVKAAAVVALGPVPIERDALGYWRLSTLVMGGDWLILSEPIAYRTPGYPWFLAVIRMVAKEYSLPAIVITQSVLMTMSIWMAGRIAAQITMLPRAMLWTLVVAIPAVSAFTFSAALLSESLFVFLLMLHLSAVTGYSARATSGRAAWVGITFALALLTRPVVMLLWIVHVPLILWVHWRRRKLVGKDASGRVKLSGRVGHFAIATLTVFVLIAPWLARNALLFDSPFVTQFVGRNLWVVTFQDGSGAGLELPQTPDGEQLQTRITRMGAADDWQLTWSVSNALVESGLSDARADQLMQQVSLDAIEANQPAFTQSAIRRVINFWRAAATELPAQGAEGSYRRQMIWKYNIPVLDAAIQYRLSQSVLLNTILAGLIAAAGIVLVVNGPSRPFGLWVLLILAYFAVVTGIFEIPAYRYRIVVEPLAASVGGAAIAVLLSRRRKPAAVVARS